MLRSSALRAGMLMRSGALCSSPALAPLACLSSAAGPALAPPARFSSTAGAAPSLEHIVLDAQGRRLGFCNPASWGSYIDRGPLDFFSLALPQWRWGTRGYALPTSNSPAAAAARVAPTSPLQATWVGHVTFLLQLGGLNILTDPVFSECAAPVQGLGIVQRYTPVPPTCTLAALPPIDVVLISHSHYDHLDRGSVGALQAMWGDRLAWVVPLGLEAELVSMGVPRAAIHVLDWWGSVSLGRRGRGRAGAGAASAAPAAPAAPATITCTPAQHQSARGLFDRNSSLWGGFVVQAGGRSVYFSGDTGYRSSDASPPCPAFSSIGAAFGSLDLALLPIGAYSPESFMRSFHCTPEEAVDMYVDVRAKAALGMHWGTFLLTDEPIEEPKARLAAAAQAKGLAPEAFRTIQAGQMWQEGGRVL
jgi:N-acyl-phosphatidylethanolamine-hydrolysing phospholipase D